MEKLQVGKRAKMFDFISFTILLLPTNFGIYMILILLSTSQHPKLKDVYIVSGLMSDKAILITGGWTEGSLQHPAELYLPHNGSGCSLPEIPERRKFHSQEAGLACGGSSRAYLEYTIYKNCWQWSPDQGVWTKSHNLAVERTFHVSWSTAAGVHLIGGHGVASNNAERLTEGGSVARAFPLKDLIV